MIELTGVVIPLSQQINKNVSLELIAEILCKERGLNNLTSAADTWISQLDKFEDTFVMGDEIYIIESKYVKAAKSGDGFVSFTLPKSLGDYKIPYAAYFNENNLTFKEAIMRCLTNTNTVVGNHMMNGGINNGQLDNIGAK